MYLRAFWDTYGTKISLGIVTLAWGFTHAVDASSLNPLPTSADQERAWNSKYDLGEPISTAGDSSSKGKKKQKGKGDEATAQVSLTLMVDGSDVSPSPSAACQLPAPSSVVDVIGVPKRDRMSVRVELVAPAGPGVRILIETLDRDLALLSQPWDGYEGTLIEVPVFQGRAESVAFDVMGINVGATDLRMWAFIDPQDPENPDDDIHYGAKLTPITVWAIEQQDIVDYGDLGRSQVCYDWTNSPALHADMGTRLGCGRPAESISADGASLQLLRLQSGGPGFACFAIVSQHVSGLPQAVHAGQLVDSVASGAALDTKATSVSTIARETAGPSASQHWAFATYIPPTDYLDDERHSLSYRYVEIELQFIPLLPDGSPGRAQATASRQKVKIVRPPVVLVHGIKSSAAMWAKAYGPWPGKQPASYFDYEQFNFDPFALNARRLHLHITDSVIQGARLKGIASTRVDIVAHSMGGNIARTLIERASQRPGDQYRRAENYRFGDIRKLATLGSPIQGTSFANGLINVHANFGHDVYPTRLRWVEALFAGDYGQAVVHLGAICDLAENSTAASYSAVPEVRGRAYAGSAGSIGSITPPLHFLSVPYSSIGQGETFQPYLFWAPNDGIVSVESASGGLDLLDEFAIQVQPDRFHSDEFFQLFPPGNMGIASSSQIASFVVGHMDWPHAWVPLPAVERQHGDDPTHFGVPWNNGRGPIDNLSWQSECIPGGPLNVLGAIEP